MTIEKAFVKPPIFIHASLRTSSTWFWTQFREISGTLCFYEPFSFTLNWLTEARAARIGHQSWDSRHPPISPYYQEYIPLLRKTGGVEGFDSAMTSQWFIPKGGLRGELRQSEKDYLTQLIRHAEQSGKISVFGDCWSLGRCWAIRNALGGHHIFQYRNLWQQWLSYLSYKRHGDLTFYVTVMDMLFRDDDPYFLYLIETGLKHAAESQTGKDETAAPPLEWRRMYVNVPRDEAKVRQLELMPEHHVFALFMGMHLYLYLHAQLSTDLSVDVTRMARDDRYRSDIERAVGQATGLPVSFSDVAEVGRPGTVAVDAAAIDWNEIREHANVAVRILSTFGDPRQLAANATAFIDSTIDEVRRVDAPLAASHGTTSIAAVEAKQPVPNKGEAAATPRRDAGMKTIGLCMIVKNESKLICQCLVSALPLVDYILVVDTGSEDGTQQIIRDFLAKHGVRGAVIDEPWRDFAYNRSFALERLREVEDVDYALVIDADDRLVLDPGFDPQAFKAQLDHDVYDVAVSHGSISHHRPQLFSNRLPFRYMGVLHEYLEAPPGNLTRATAAGFSVHASTGGARSQNPRKYQDDAALLERALTTETDPFLISRYTFYLAQSYRDCGEREKAVETYLKRAELGFWDEEIYISLLEAGNHMAALERPFEHVIATYERASQIVPTRAEALHAASLYCRNKGKNAEGQEFARRGIALAQPGGLFIQPWVYDYGILDEFAINAYWAGAYRESLDASLKLLASGKLPPSMVARVAANARFAADKLPAAESKASTGRKATKRRVVWHRPGAIGDVLITLNFVKLYKKENPNDWVIYKTAPSTASMLRPIMLEAGVDEVVTTADEVACDKQFNLIGYPLHEGYPERPMAGHLIHYFSEELGLGGRYKELQLKLPKRTIDPPYITLHATAGWSMYKNWPLDRWAWVCEQLKQQGIQAVQIGGPGDQVVESVAFNRLGLPFLESLGLFANAELHVGIDSWSNHATNIVWEGKGKVPGVILWGSTQASSAGYPQNYNISLGLPCQPCFREDPKISAVPRGVCPNPPGQTYEQPLHACMHGISREHVLDLILQGYANAGSVRS